MKTSELTGAPLNLAVARAQGYFCDGQSLTRPDPLDDGALEHIWLADYDPAGDWSQGGPIIERERITLDGTAILNQWMAVFYVPDEEPWEMRGPTPLIAAMRCFVASKLGDNL
jgi:hypothetical protein